MTDEELKKYNKDIDQTESVGCGCVVSFFVSAIAIVAVCIGGIPKEQFIPTLLLFLFLFGGGSFLLTYLFVRSWLISKPVDIYKMNCPNCGKKIMPLDILPPASPNDGPRCPTCKQLLNPSVSDIATENNPEKTTSERDA